MEKPILRYDEIEETKVSKHFKTGTILFLILLPFVFLFTICWALIDGFSKDGGGQYNIISSTPSPDGKNVAVVYSGWGGGAAGWTFLRATVVSADEQFKPEEHNNYIFDLKGGRNVETTWENNGNLLISYKYKPEKTNSYLRVSKEIYSRHTGINIRFIEKNE